MHGHVIVKRKCPSTNFVLTIFFLQLSDIFVQNKIN